MATSKVVLQIYIHVRSANGDAKCWIQPEVMLADRDGYDGRELRDLNQVVIAHSDLIEMSLNAYLADAAVAG